MSEKVAMMTSGLNEDLQHVFSLFREAKTKKCKVVKVGEITEDLDKSIGRPVQNILGLVSAKNYVEFSDLSLNNPYVYVQIKRVDQNVATFHFEIMTDDNLSMRISVSTLYSKNPTSLDRILRLPFPMFDSWMIIAMDLNALIRRYSKRTFVSIKNIQVCSNVSIRDIVTTSSPLHPNIQNLPKELAVKVGSDSLVWIDYANFDSNNIDSSVLFLGSRNSKNLPHERLNATERALEESYESNASMQELATSLRASNARLTASNLAKMQKINKEVDLTSQHKSTPLKKTLTIDDLRVNSNTKRKTITPTVEKTQSKTQHSTRSVLKASNSGAIHDEANDVLALERVLFYDGKQSLFLCNGKISVMICGKILVLIDIEHRAEKELQRSGSSGIWKAFLNNTTVKANISSGQHGSDNEKTYLEIEGYRQAFLKAHSDPVSFIEVSNDEVYLVSCENVKNGLAVVWDLNQGRPVATFRPHSNGITCAAFNRDNSSLVTVGHDAQHRSQVVIWDLQMLVNEPKLAGPEAAIAKQLSDFPIARIAFSPYDDHSLISCGRENIRFWRVKKGHLPGRPVLLNEYSRGFVFTEIGFVTDVSASSVKGDKKRLALIASNKGLLFKVDCDNETLLSAFQLHDSGISSMRVFSGGVVTGSADKSLRIWPFDFADFLLEAHFEGTVTSLSVCEGKGRSSVLVGTSSGTLGTLDMASHNYSTVLRSHSSQVHSVSKRSGGIINKEDGFEFVTVGSDFTIRIWDGVSGLQKYEFTSLNDEPKCAAFHNCENEIAVGFASGYIRVFDIHTTSTIVERKCHQGPVSQLLFVDSDMRPIKLDDSSRKAKSKSPNSGISRKAVFLLSMALDGSLVIYEANRQYSALKTLLVTSPQSNIKSAHLIYQPELNLVAFCYDTLETLTMLEVSSKNSWRVVCRAGQLHSMNIDFEKTNTKESFPISKLDDAEVSKSMEKNVVNDEENTGNELADLDASNPAETSFNSSEIVSPVVATNKNINNDFVISLQTPNSTKSKTKVSPDKSPFAQSTEDNLNVSVTGLSFRGANGGSVSLINELIVFSEKEVIVLNLDAVLAGNHVLSQTHGSNLAASHNSKGNKQNSKLSNLFDSKITRKIDVGNVLYGQYLSEYDVCVMSAINEHNSFDRKGTSKAFQTSSNSDKSFDNSLILIAIQNRTKKQSRNMVLSNPEFHIDNFAKITHFSCLSKNGKLLSCDENGCLLIYGIRNKNIQVLCNNSDPSSPDKVNHNESFEPIRMEIIDQVPPEVPETESSGINHTESPKSPSSSALPESDLAEMEKSILSLRTPLVDKPPLVEDSEIVNYIDNAEENQLLAVAELRMSNSPTLTSPQAIFTDVNIDGTLDHTVEDMEMEMEMNKEIQNMIKSNNRLKMSMEYDSVFNIKSALHNHSESWKSLQELLESDTSSTVSGAANGRALHNAIGGEPQYLSRSKRVVLYDSSTVILKSIDQTLPDYFLTMPQEPPQCISPSKVISVSCNATESLIAVITIRRPENTSGNSTVFEFIVYKLNEESSGTICLGGVQLESADVQSEYASVNFHKNDGKVDSDEHLLIFVPVKQNIEDQSNMKSVSMHTMIADIPISQFSSINHSVVNGRSLSDVLYDHFSIVSIPFKSVSGVKLLPSYHSIIVNAAGKSDLKDDRDGFGLVIFGPQTFALYHATTNRQSKSSAIHVSPNGKHFLRIWQEIMGPGVNLVSSSTTSMNNGALCMSLSQGGASQGGKLWATWIAPDSTCRDLQTAQPLPSAQGIPTNIQFIDRENWYKRKYAKKSTEFTLSTARSSKSSSRDSISKNAKLIISNQAQSLSTSTSESQRKEDSIESSLLCVTHAHGLQLLAICIHKSPLYHPLHKERLRTSSLTQGDRWQIITHKLAWIQTTQGAGILYSIPLRCNSGIGFMTYDNFGQLGYYVSEKNEAKRGEVCDSRLQNDPLTKMLSNTKFTYKKLRTSEPKGVTANIVDICTGRNISITVFPRDILVEFIDTSDLNTYSFANQLSAKEVFTKALTIENTILLGTSCGRTFVLNVRPSSSDFVENLRILNFNHGQEPESTNTSHAKNKLMYVTPIDGKNQKANSIPMSPAVIGMKFASTNSADTESESLLVIFYQNHDISVYRISDYKLEFESNRSEKDFDFVYHTSLYSTNCTESKQSLFFDCCNDNTICGIVKSCNQFKIISFHDNSVLSQSENSQDLRHVTADVNIKFDARNFHVFDETDDSNRVESVKMIQDGDDMLFLVIIGNSAGLRFFFSLTLSSTMVNGSTLDSNKIHLAKLLCVCKEPISRIQYMNPKTLGLFVSNHKWLLCDVEALIKCDAAECDHVDQVPSIDSLHVCKSYSIASFTVSHGFSSDLQVTINPSMESNNGFQCIAITSSPFSYFKLMFSLAL